MSALLSKLVFGFVLVLVLIPVSACATSPAPSALPPPSPAPGTQTNHLPLSLQDVQQTQVYRFRVDPAQTTVEYAVNEVLLGTDQITRGRTNSVEGEFQLYMENGRAYIALSNLQVDLRTLTTDNAVRDQAIRKRWLESDQYPKAIFVATNVQGLPLDARQGQPYQFQVIGDLTVRNVTHSVTFDVTVSLQNDSIVGEGTTVINMGDFGFEPPSIVGKTIVRDPVTISIKGVANLVGG